MRKTRSIKWTLAFTYLSALVLPIIVAGWLIMGIAAGSLREEIVSRNTMLATKLAEQVHDYLDHPVESLGTVKSLAERGWIAPANFRAYLDLFLESHLDFLKIQITDSEGIVTHLSPRDDEFMGVDVSNQDYFRKTVERGSAYWSSSFVSLQLGKPVVALSIPMEAGVISGFVSLSKLTGAVRSALAGKGSLVTMTDQTGVFIAHPDESKILEREYDPKSPIFSGDASGAVHLRTLEMGGRKMTGFSRVIGRTKWKVVVYQDARDLYRPIRKLYAASGLCILFMVAMTLFICRWHIRSMVSEVGRFTAAAKVLSDGKYGERMNLTTYAEFGPLASQFNRMAGSIEEREVSVRESERKLRRILDSVGVGIFMTDPADMSIIYANPAAGQMLGRSREDLMESRCMDLVCGVEDGRCPVINGARRMDVSERELLTNDGRPLSVLKTATATVLSGRECIVESFIDLTPLKKVEKEKLKLEQQLSQLRKMEAIGTLAGGIAHDFNNMLFPILGYAEMIRDDLPAGSALHAHVAEILKAAMRSKKLVQQILAFSRQSDEELAPLRVQSVLEEVLQLTRATLPATIEIRQEIDPGTLPVLADPTQLHQIVMNLVTNAYHAMEASGGILNVMLKQVVVGLGDLDDSDMAPGGYVCLSVGDTGAGMDRQTLVRIFEPYFTTKAQGKGTGLGLSVVHGIIKKYGGGIRAYSEPGVGSNFVVYLPEYESGKEASPEAAPRTATGGEERILLVDDEPQILMMLRMMLERLGYTVRGETGSPDALEAFSAAPDGYDLVITDMTMPKMTGLQLSRELLRIRPDLPVIICSGFSEQLRDNKVRDPNIRGVVMKPVVMADIARAVRSALAG